MAFDFEKNIEEVAPLKDATDKIAEILREKIQETIFGLNNKYYKKIVQSTYHMKEDEPFTYTKHFTHEGEALHFYTRDIKNSGIGAWRTLNYWVENTEYLNMFSDIYFNGAAYVSYDFFMETLGTEPGDYISFKIHQHDEFELNFNYIMSYMNCVKKFRQIHYASSYDFFSGAYFRANRIVTLHNSIEDIRKFVKFCKTYEDNPEYPVKFNISFVMSIINCICNWREDGFAIMQDISDAYKAILNESDELFLSANDIAEVINKFKLI